MSIDPRYYSSDVNRIQAIEFSVYRNKDVKKYSAVSSDPFGINLAESYENYEPKKGGLVDLRLGTCDTYLRCVTCGLNNRDCPGHFGHTELAEYVFHFGFLDHLKSILQCICLKCSNLLIEKSDSMFNKALHKKAEQRFKEIKLLTKTINFCFHCGAPVSKIKKEVKPSGISISIEREVGSQNVDTKTGELHEGSKRIKETLNPRDCWNILRNVSDNDCFLLGFNPKMARPEDLIIYILPVPPVSIRPSNKIDLLSSSTMEDALTIKIADIINSNKRVRQQMEKESVSAQISNYNQDIFNLLQFHVALFYANDSVTLPRSEFKSGGKALKMISERISGKHGRVRGNILGNEAGRVCF